nr:MAG TPA: hypothetical protein [Caudoviricetes sp.]
MSFLPFLKSPFRFFFHYIFLVLNCQYFLVLNQNAQFAVYY